MTNIPVILDDTSTDILYIAARMARGTGNIILSGLISPEVEDEIPKAISAAARLSDLGELSLPDLSAIDIRINFACRSSQLPVRGKSYSLGLAVELLRLFSGRSWPDHFCYTGGLDEHGLAIPVECVKQKLDSAADAGFDRCFLPGSQLEFFNKRIRQIPVETIFEAWGVLTYGT